MLPDIQSESDHRGIPVTVGVDGIVRRITLLTPDLSTIDVDAVITATCGLPANARGVHMSRFYEILDDVIVESPTRVLTACVESLIEKMCLPKAMVTAQFVYPISRQDGYMSAKISVRRGFADLPQFFVSISRPVMTVCPCSLAMSITSSAKWSSHTQRCTVDIAVSGTCGDDIVWLEDLADCVCGSAPVRCHLKRSDESELVASAFGNPMFIEDVVRDTLLYTVGEFQDVVDAVEVRAMSQESIHPYDVVATATWRRDEDQDQVRTEEGAYKDS